MSIFIDNHDFKLYMKFILNFRGLVNPINDDIINTLKHLRSVSMRDRKHLIMDTALELFKEHGIPHTSIQMILETSQVAKGTFYKYFNSKSDVIVAILEQSHQDDMVIRRGWKPANTLPSWRCWPTNWPSRCLCRRKGPFSKCYGRSIIAESLKYRR